MKFYTIKNLLVKTDKGEVSIFDEETRVVNLKTQNEEFVNLLNQYDELLTAYTLLQTQKNIGLHIYCIENVNETEKTIKESINEVTNFLLNIYIHTQGRYTKKHKKIAYHSVCDMVSYFCS